jgi:hypothetical protein
MWIELMDCQIVPYMRKIDKLACFRYTILVPNFTHEHGQYMQQQSQQPALLGDSVIQTKLTVPPSRSAVVVRSRLLTWLDAGLRSPLTLIAAPAGFGKTTLLSTWRARLSDNATPLAWLTLEEDDNDPLRFWRYLISALDLLQSGIAASFSTSVQGFQPASLKAMLP